VLDILKILTIDDVLNFLAKFVLYASIFNTLLPPIEWFDKYARFKKYYSIFVLVLSHYASLNIRGMVWNKYIQPNSTNTEEK
jgi:hypothetical protein